MNNSGDPFKAKADEFDGPTKRRNCTDTFFLVLFAAFIIGLVSRYLTKLYFYNFIHKAYNILYCVAIH